MTSIDEIAAVLRQVDQPSPELLDKMHFHQIESRDPGQSPRRFHASAIGWLHDLRVLRDSAPNPSMRNAHERMLLDAADAYKTIGLISGDEYERMIQL